MPGGTNEIRIHRDVRASTRADARRLGGVRPRNLLPGDRWPFGARIEEKIVVTATGHEVITLFPAEELIIAVLEDAAMPSVDRIVQTVRKSMR